MPKESIRVILSTTSMKSIDKPDNKLKRFARSDLVIPIPLSVTVMVCFCLSMDIIIRGSSASAQTSEESSCSISSKSSSLCSSEEKDRYIVEDALELVDDSFLSKSSSGAKSKLLAEVFLVANFARFRSSKECEATLTSSLLKVRIILVSSPPPRKTKFDETNPLLFRTSQTNSPYFQSRCLHKSNEIYHFGILKTNSRTHGPASALNSYIHLDTFLSKTRHNAKMQARK